MNSLAISTTTASGVDEHSAGGSSAARAVRRLLASVGAARVGFVIVPLLSYWLAAAHHLHPRIVALLMAGFGAGWAISAPLGGWLADRIGARATIATTSLIAAGAYLILGAVDETVALTAAAVLTGATFDAYRPPLQAALTAHTTSPAAAAAVQRWLYLTLNGSRILSCLLGAALLGVSWTALFLVNAAANLVLAALTLAQPAGLYPQTPSAGDQPRAAVFRDWRLLAITGLTFAFHLVHLQSGVSLPVLLHAHGSTAPGYALLLALDPAVVLLVQAATGRWLARVPALISCALGASLVTIGLVGAGLTATLATAAWTLPIWVTGELLFLTAAPAVVAGIAPPAQRGAYFGLWAATQGAGAVCAPLLAAAVTGRALWLLTAAIGSTATAGLLTWHRATSRR